MATVLAYGHSRSLQLLCTVGGNQAKLDARNEFEFCLKGVEAVMHAVSIYLQLSFFSTTLLIIKITGERK